MIRLAVSVEGQTEREFVNKVLYQHMLQSCCVSVTPVLLGGARANRAAGGNATVEKLVSDMATLSHTFDAVSSLVDFYGFREKENYNVEDLVEMVRRGVEERASGRGDRIIPYIQMHEFEGLLFSDAKAFSSVVREELSLNAVEELSRIRENVDSPEDINDNFESAPSRQI